MLKLAALLGAAIVVIYQPIDGKKEYTLKWKSGDHLAASSPTKSDTRNPANARDTVRNLPKRKVVDLFHCAGGEHSTIGIIPFDVYNVFFPDCAPEVLYTWQSFATVKTAVIGGRTGIGLIAARSGAPLFAVRTPLASHAYGDLSVRIKLRKDVKFVFSNYETPFEVIDDGGPQSALANSKPIRDCEYYRKKYPSEIGRTVIVSVLPKYDDFSEYMLCDDGPVESWSYGQPAHLKEILNEYNRFEAGKPVESLLESLTSNAGSSTDSVERIKYCPDGHPCSEADLARRIKNESSVVQKRVGEIFYSSDVKHDPLQHFWTDNVWYFSLSDTSLKQIH